MTIKLSNHIESGCEDLVSPLLLAKPTQQNLEAIRGLLRCGIDQALEQASERHSVAWSGEKVDLNDDACRYAYDALNAMIVGRGTLQFAEINAIRRAFERWIDDACEDLATTETIDRDGVHIKTSRDEVYVTVQSPAGGGELTLHPDDWEKFAAVVAQMTAT